MKSLIFAFFILFFFFFFDTATAGERTDCNIYSVDIFSIQHGELYTHCPFQYERNYYYNFTLFPLQDEVVAGITFTNTTFSPNLVVSLYLDKEILVRETPNALIPIPLERLNNTCGSTNHFVFEAYDQYQMYIFNYLVRSEACRYKYELFLYNPPCQTVPNLY